MPETASLQPERSFALLLETACGEFETLLKMVRNEIQLVSPSAKPGDFSIFRAEATIQMALAKAFLFNANRANRVCSKNKSRLQLDRKIRDEFLRATKPLADVRDVNEHGYDGDKRSEKNRPSLHDQGGGFGDETSLAIEGPHRIMMGPLNLSDIYVAVAKMRSIAGFSSLPPTYPELAAPTASSSPTD
jgi:hypothetical protein